MKVSYSVFAALSPILLAGSALFSGAVTAAAQNTEPGIGRVEKTLDGEREVRGRVDAFFVKIEAGKTPEAFDDLFKGSPQSEDPKIVSGFVKKTDDITGLFGKITSHELIRIKRVGSRLIQFTYLSHSDNYPLKWEIYCYLGKSGWQLLDFSVNKDLEGLFSGSAARTTLLPTSSR